MVYLEFYIYLVFECMSLFSMSVTDEVYYARSFVKYKKRKEENKNYLY